MSLTIPETIRVLLPGGAVRKLALEEYVRGVVAATLPADAPIEALKAQAVAARTFGAITRRHIERGSDVCTLRHCQHWKDSSSAPAQRAAQETRGIVAVHNGKLIDAFYFEHCDGNTRDATGVLIQVPPYLKSVTCPCGFATLKGHGIGMCQRGAQVMARFGDSSDTILKHYFNGITLERANAVPLTSTEQRAAPSTGITASLPSLKPEAADRATKTGPGAKTTKVTRPPAGASPAPAESKPSGSVASSPSSKGKGLVETAKSAGVVQLPPIDSPRRAEPPKVADFAQKKPESSPPSLSTEPAQQAEAPKAEVAPAVPPPEAIERVETSKKPDAIPPRRSEPAPQAEPRKVAEVAQEKPESSPTPRPSESTRQAEAPKAVEVSPAVPLTKPTPRVEPSKKQDAVPPRPGGPARQAEPPKAADVAPKKSELGPAPQPGGPTPRVDTPSKPDTDRTLPSSDPTRRTGSKIAGVARTPPLKESARRIEIPRPAENIQTPPIALPGPSMSKLSDSVSTPRKTGGPPETLIPARDGQEEIGWYPIAEDIVMRADGYEQQVIDDSITGTDTTVPPVAKTTPPASSPTPTRAAAPPASGTGAAGKPVKAPTSSPRGSRRQPPPAPSSMPEDMPVIPVISVTAAVVAQAPPPPLVEEDLLGTPITMAGPPVLIDRLPGPRMIAGDLARPGTIITIRDVNGHAVVTVSGAAPHHGEGGFEAPIASHGRYAVTFGHHALEVDLDDETVFIQLPS